jgi:hypothetical protein
MYQRNSGRNAPSHRLLCLVALAQCLAAIAVACGSAPEHVFAIVSPDASSTDGNVLLDGAHASDGPIGDGPATDGAIDAGVCLAVGASCDPDGGAGCCAGLGCIAGACAPASCLLRAASCDVEGGVPCCAGEGLVCVPPSGGGATCQPAIGQPCGPNAGADGGPLACPKVATSSPFPGGGCVAPPPDYTPGNPSGCTFDCGPVVFDVNGVPEIDCFQVQLIEACVALGGMCLARQYVGADGGKTWTDAYCGAGCTCNGSTCSCAPYFVSGMPLGCKG